MPPAHLMAHQRLKELEVKRIAETFKNLLTNPKTDEDQKRATGLSLQITQWENNRNPLTSEDPGYVGTKYNLIASA